MWFFFDLLTFYINFHKNCTFRSNKKLDRDDYLQNPKESITPAGVKWKWITVCGLKDSAIQYYFSAKEELDKLGFKACIVDQAIAYFCLKKDWRLHEIICSDVDFPHAWDEIFKRKVAECQFWYIGFYIKQNQDGIELHNTKYK